MLSGEATHEEETLQGFVWKYFKRYEFQSKDFLGFFRRKNQSFDHFGNRFKSGTWDERRSNIQSPFMFPSAR